MKIKIIIILLISILLVGCKKEEPVDTTSSATGEYNPEGVTKADKQFGRLRSNEKKQTKYAENKSENLGNNFENSDNHTEDIKIVRPEITQFIVEQFYDENSIIKELDGLEYRVNETAISSIFKGVAEHKFKNVAYPYTIEIQHIGEDVANADFVKTVKSKYSYLKVLNMKPYGDVLLENIDDNPYSGELHVLWNSRKSYYIIFKSEVMSIPEMLVLSEQFAKYLK